MSRRANLCSTFLLKTYSETASETVLLSLTISTRVQHIFALVGGPKVGLEVRLLTLSCG